MGVIKSSSATTDSFNIGQLDRFVSVCAKNCKGSTSLTLTRRNSSLWTYSTHNSVYREHLPVFIDLWISRCLSSRIAIKGSKILPHSKSCWARVFGTTLASLQTGMQDAPEPWQSFSIRSLESDKDRNKDTPSNVDFRDVTAEAGTKPARLAA